MAAGGHVVEEAALEQYYDDGARGRNIALGYNID